MNCLQNLSIYRKNTAILFAFTTKSFTCHLPVNSIYFVSTTWVLLMIPLQCLLGVYAWRCLCTSEVCFDGLFAFIGLARLASESFSDPILFANFFRIANFLRIFISVDFFCEFSTELQIFFVFFISADFFCEFLTEFYLVA